MANRLYKAPVTRVTPGTPGRAAIPAYCIDEPVLVDYGYHINLQRMADMTRQMTGYYPGQVKYYAYGGSYVNRTVTKVTQNISNAALDQFSGIAYGTGIYIGWYWRTCYPAVKAIPAIPPKISYDSMPGWNSGGLSYGSVKADGYVEFSLAPAAHGALAGISTSRADTVIPWDCSHAFYASGGVLHVFEGMQSVYTVPGGTAGKPLLRIKRAAGVVTYWRNGSMVYTSALPSAGVMRLDASLYMAGDYVDNPVIAGINRISASGRVGVKPSFDMRPKASGRVGVSAYAQMASGNRRYLSASGRAGITTQPASMYATHNIDSSGRVGVSGLARASENYSRGSYSSWAGVASVAGVSFSNGEYKAGYIGAAHGGMPSIQISYSAGFAPMPVGFSRALVGGIGRAHGAAPAARGAAGSTGYAFVRGVYGGGYRGFSYASWLGKSASIQSEVVVLRDSIHLEAEIYASFASVLQIGSSVSLVMEVASGIEWFESILMSSTIHETGDRYLDFFDRLLVTTQANIPALEGIQYATNINTGAITRYNGFDFMATTSTERGVFGVRPDGIYRIGGSADNGDGIDLSVDLGAHDLGTNQGKRVEAVYLGFATDGEVLAVLKADDGQEHTYKVESREPIMRAMTAKGVQGKAWRLSLKVYEATKAELDSVELAVGTSSRRLSGARR